MTCDFFAARSHVSVNIMLLISVNIMLISCLTADEVNTNKKQIIHKMDILKRVIIL